MTQVHEDPAAAHTDPEHREVDDSLATEAANGAGARADDVIAALTHVDADVLRALHAAQIEPVKLPPALSPAGAAKIDIELAKRAEPQLRGLRSILLDYADGVVPLGENDDRPVLAVGALRDLLEIVLKTALALPGEEKRAAPTAEKDLDDVVARARGVVDPQPAAPGQTWTVQNLTARLLTVRGHDGTKWDIPAYGGRAFAQDPRVELDLRDEEARGRVKVIDPPKSKRIGLEVLSVYIWLVPGAVVAGKVWGLWGWVAGAIVLAAPAAYVLFGEPGEGRERLRSFASDFPAWVMQALTFVLVLAFCLVVPAATIVYGADLKPVLENVANGKGTSDEYLTLVCRAMQVVLISIASLLPALLYYQFDRDRLSTLREKFVHQIFRLDSWMTTTGAIDAKYGRLIDETYGPERSGRYRKLPPGRRAPIFVATVLVMLGWLLVLLNPDVKLITDEGTIAGLFEPRHTAPAFAFLGAYFFTLFALLRGYVRRDLRPKSYSDISVRIITVVILAWVLELIFVDDSSWLFVFAFAVGIVPQVALNKVRELTERGGLWRKQQGAGGTAPSGGELSAEAAPEADSAVAAAFSDPLPLTALEGIDLYDRTRLASEGVTNIEALAHHDLIDLMLLTRIPVPRLVDWTDQAILYLHVCAAEDRAKLRRYGIRTASDLVQACDVSPEFGAILDGDSKGTAPSRLPVIVKAMRDEAWMASILSWHRSTEQQADAALDTDRSSSGPIV